ncbi:hypothetical protein DSM106972_029120 [Dulcicalothrix desertica PCC 7102]|uniref:Uncharacterized protein n=1 Tax=Dulcicalothrix desertica PCC 7102 TaxID=232991 RepID=A0A433VKT4_9CYAN|nr:hypothetical protein [Dulcicalothrix desertica]RUT06655.1 hypothetical protein DSM106972_029120 [Dulcicalothrix desertica PCC 7102]TWH50233.1 hypothetical protein CAL7102_04525 [Dulcicalothrix desertica PCC 7102]
MNRNKKINTTVVSLKHRSSIRNISRLIAPGLFSAVLLSSTASYGFIVEEKPEVATLDKTDVTSSQNQLLEKLRAHARSRYADVQRELIVKQPISLSEFNRDFNKVSNKEDSKRYSKLLNALKPFSQQQVAQTDSSGTVGDSFGELNKSREDLLIEPIVIETRTSRRVAPASSAGTPTGYGASSKQAYIGGGVRFPFDGDRDRVDGSLSFGFGEGDAINSLGVEFNFNITSVGGGNFNDFDFGDSGTIGFKLHKYFGRGTAAAFGWSNPIRWGDTVAANATVYGVVTQAFPLISNQLPLTVSVGVGSGAFRSKGAILNGENTPNLFGSVGLQVTPEISLVSSWTGNRLNVGASVVPIKKFPLVINAIFTDVTDNLNEGSGLTIVAGSAFQF